MRVALELVVGGPADRHRDALPQRRPRYGDLAGPAGAEEVLTLDAPGEPAHQRGRALQLRAQQQCLAGVRIGSAGLGVEIVAVVPDGDQPEVAHGSEGSGPGADHDPAGAAADGEEVAVASRRARVGGQRDVVTFAEHCGEGSVDPGDVLHVGHADQGSATGVVGGGGGMREQPRPVVAGGGSPRPRGVRHPR